MPIARNHVTCKLYHLIPGPVLSAVTFRTTVDPTTISPIVRAPVRRGDECVTVGALPLHVFIAAGGDLVGLEAWVAFGVPLT